MRGPRVVALFGLSLALLAPSVLQGDRATRLQRWVDAEGVIHYSDHRRRTVGRSDFSTDPAAVARTAELSLHEDTGVYVALVRNLLHGPVEVELDISAHDNVSAWPRLPHRMALGSGEQRSVSAIEKINPVRAGHFELHLLAMPGLPGAQHDESTYAMPVAAGTASIVQGFGGGFSHTDPQNLHAIDFAVPEGTPVLAARGGTVMQVVDDHAGGGMDREAFVHRANHVRILHADGSMAVYAHLQQGGSRVRAGQEVDVGEHIADSGNTGFSSGPHLHFVVQVNTGMALESVPITLVDEAGAPAPVPGMGAFGPGPGYRSGAGGGL